MWRVAIVGVVLGGCSPDLTCALLESPSNCYAQTAAALAACMPMRGTPAKLSADKTTCTFSDGVSVVFNNPVPQLQVHVTDPTGIALTVFGVDGSMCGHVYYFENAADGVSIRAGSLSAGWETPLDDGGFELRCPSHTYTTSADDPLVCQGDVVPRFGYSTAGPPYSFSVASAATPSTLFTCE